jgi:hypothetical protein
MSNPRNAGRKPTGMFPIIVRVTPEQKEWLQERGQSDAVRLLIDKEMKR